MSKITVEKRSVAHSRCWFRPSRFFFFFFHNNSTPCLVLISILIALFLWAPKHQPSHFPLLCRALLSRAMVGVPSSWAFLQVSHSKKKAKAQCLVKHTHGMLVCIANLSDEAIDALVSGLETGVYYGWTQIGELGSEVYPMVMSLGWNPYFKNEKRSAVSDV